MVIQFEEGLWGEKMEKGDGWYEKQIPRILDYPVKGNGKSVYMLLNEYTFENNGSTIYRFKGVIAGEF